MKYNSLKYALGFISLISITLWGCLKDDSFDNHQSESVAGDGNQKVVSIAITATNTTNHLQMAFDKSDVDTTFDVIPVTLAGQPATEDIKVTLIYDPALLGDYDAANGATHEEAPTNLYTVINPGDSVNGYVVTIPKGSNTGYLQIKLKPNDFLGFDYALGMQISKVEPASYLIASNLSSGIVAIGVKNEWDGIYSYKGYSLRAGDATLTGNFTDQEMPLVTKGANSVGFASLALWGDGNSQISIGNPLLTIDNTGSAPYPVTITSEGGGKNAPGYNSRYEPDTKTFYISFTWGAGPSARLSTDTLTYLRPR
jgi:hypothetical protein